MFHWFIEAEARAKTTPRQVWRAWTDISSWHQWNDCSATLKGSFANGATGVFKRKRSPSSRFTIVTAEEEQRFAVCSRFLNTKVTRSHFVAPWWDGQVRIVHRVEVSGLFAPIFRLFFRRKQLAKTLQKLVLQLK